MSEGAAFWFFLGIVALILTGLGYLLRGALAKAAANAGANPKAYLKGGGLVLMAMMANFEKTFGGLTPAQASALTWWHWVIYFGAPIVAGLAVVVALLDNSFSSHEKPPGT